MDYTALKAELDAGHPVTGAYDANNATAADQLNAVNQTANRTSISGDELFTSTDSTEFAALTDHKRELWVAFCSKDVDPFSSANVAFVQWVFGGGSTTVVTLADIRTADVSRATKLGLGLVKESHVAYARTL
jgi:hypothetical protein